MVEAANANSPASSIVLSDAIICDEESIEIVEISQQIIRNGGETIWLLLNREIDKADIFIEFDQITIPVESIRIYGKVIIFIIPIFELPDEKSSNYGENNAVFLRVNLQKIRLPLAFLSREYINGVCNHDLSNEETSSQINSLFDFASGGDPIVLLKPVIPLFKVCDKELCK
ncbi:unnamed protein product [Dracunculus medinensis]|uniref:Uncharacterized protein n=1 Tax=Dracunculus medinensis TaxID=318479 RepID=A0A0N4UIV2_DRAME|nr:unnamed protein product [Dracunculus medinensis]